MAIGDQRYNAETGVDKQPGCQCGKQLEELPAFGVKYWCEMIAYPQNSYDAQLLLINCHLTTGFQTTEIAGVEKLRLFPDKFLVRTRIGAGRLHPVQANADCQYRGTQRQEIHGKAVRYLLQQTG